MRNRTFPKENEKKLKEQVRELKSLLLKLQKENKFLHQEIENLIKPVRDRKPHLEQVKQNHEDWKKDFIKRFKKEVLGEKV